LTEELNADLIEIADSEHCTTLELLRWLEEAPLLENTSSLQLVESELLMREVLWERTQF